MIFRFNVIVRYTVAADTDELQMAEYQAAKLRAKVLDEFYSSTGSIEDGKDLRVSVQIETPVVIRDGQFCPVSDPGGSPDVQWVTLCLS